MEIRKHMLAYFERTSSSTRQSPGFEPNSISNPRQTELLLVKKIRTSQIHSKYPNSDSLTTKSDSLHRSLSSKNNSNKSSRNSPARFYLKQIKKNEFRESFLKTVNELIKIRSLKISKHVEMVTKEIRLIKKLKNLVDDEIKLCKKQEESKAVEDVNEKLSVIMKQSAEELLVLEQKIKITIEENSKLQNELEKILSLETKKKQERVVVRKVFSVQDCLNELAKADRDSSTLLMDEPELQKGYICNIEEMAKELVKSLTGKDVNALPGVLALQLSREKMFFEQRKKHFQESLNTLRIGRKSLEKRLKKRKKSFEDHQHIN